MSGKVRVFRSVARLAIAGSVLASLAAQSVEPLPSPLLPADSKSITGQQISLDPNGGARVVVLDFFTSYCIPCGPEATQLERVHHRFAGNGVLVVGIDVGEDAARATEFARENHLTYPVITDDGKMEKQYRAWGYPLAIIIDQRAKTMKRIEGEQGDLEDIVSRVVGGRQ
jgi:peroxiredoxin